MMISPIIPEMTLLIFTSIILLLGNKLAKFKVSTIFILTIIGLLLAIYFAAKVLYLEPSMALQHKYIHSITMFLHDQCMHGFTTSCLKIIVLISTIWMFFYIHPYLENNITEYYVLILLSVTGILVLISANTLLTIFLGMELLSLPICALIALDRKNPLATEAAIKYFLLNAVAASLTLYGMSLLYGITNNIDLYSIGKSFYLVERALYHYGMIIALLLLFTGVGFKLAIVPYHGWLPDSYTGAPLSTIIYLATVAKIAAFVLFWKLFIFMVGNKFAYIIIPSMLTLATISIFFGSIIAVLQTNLRRLFGYATIANMGFLLLALVNVVNNNLYIDPVPSYGVALFYLVTYVFTALCLFGLLFNLTKTNKIEDLSDLQGLYYRNPLLAFAFLLILLAQAGVPPLLGFWAKFFIIYDMILHHYFWLTGFVVLMTVVAAYYYLKIIRLMFFVEPVQFAKIVLTNNMQMFVVFNCSLLLVLGCYPSRLLSLTTRIFG